MLSFSKLTKLLKDLDFKLMYIYKNSENNVLFLEIVCNKYGNNLLVSIQDKFKIKLEEEYDNCIKLSELKTKISDPEYDDVDVDIDKQEDIKKLNEKLTDKYRDEIVLDDVTDEKVIKENVKQLERLYFSIKKTNYNICIIQENFISYTNGSEEIITYRTNKMYMNNLDNKKKLLIITNLESIYSESKQVSHDIEHIYTSLSEQIIKIQNTHTNLFVKLLEHQQQIKSSFLLVTQKINKINEYIKQLTQTLHKVNVLIENAEKEKKEHIENNSDKMISSEIVNSHIIFKYDNDIKSMLDIKKQVISNILQLKENKQNVIINSDKFLYQNNIMLNEIINNVNNFISLYN